MELKVTTYAVDADGVATTIAWARARGCPWNKGTCSNAAFNGHLDVLQWARANGCAWDVWTFHSAKASDNAALLEWVRANGCPGP